MILIKNGKIITMTEKDYCNGSILIEEGKIVEVGENIDIPINAKIIDAKGGWILPGLIDAHCHIGIMEEEIGIEGLDVNEATEPITPHLRAIDGINPLDVAFNEAIQSGITTVMTGPGSANPIGGQFVAMKTSGICVDDMIIKQPAAIKVAFGENPKRIYKNRKKMPTTRMGIAGLIRGTLNKAKNYKIKKDKAFKKGESFESDLKMEAMLSVINKEIPLKVHAHRFDDLLTAIRIAKEFDINLTLDHCTEGNMIGNYIKKSNFPAILGPTMTSKSKIETRNKTFTTPGKLNSLGIKIAIMTDHPVVPISYLPLCAGFAVKYGLDLKEAFKAITINSAEILGIDDRVGSIEKGKDADIAIYNGNPMEIFTKTLYTIIDGNIVYDYKNQ